MATTNRDSHAWAAAGAFAGAAAQWSVSTLWTAPTLRVGSTLVLAGIAGFVIGALRRHGHLSAGRSALCWSFAGTTAALAPVAAFAVAQQPPLFFACLLLFPVCVAGGAAAGSAIRSDRVGDRR